jgi:hypothetical protein
MDGFSFWDRLELLSIELEWDMDATEEARRMLGF